MYDYRLAIGLLFPNALAKLNVCQFEKIYYDQIVQHSCDIKREVAGVFSSTRPHVTVGLRIFFIYFLPTHMQTTWAVIGGGMVGSVKSPTLLD